MQASQLIGMLRVGLEGTCEKYTNVQKSGAFVEYFSFVPPSLVYSPKPAEVSVPPDPRNSQPRLVTAVVTKRTYAGSTAKFTKV